uniref:Uncharacterized protein n=1 Tax=Nelumbo nucifera TaxID=4432 RepID=A0A822XXR1_NELNU|nr:TPA_asm: hypothetical protein HUJ06_023641 [Nelumbo nucifera]
MGFRPGSIERTGILDPFQSMVVCLLWEKSESNVGLNVDAATGALVIFLSGCFL